MPELWQATHRYDSSWASLVLAFALRYPSPVTPHIVSVDVVSRRVHPSNLCVETERIILKRGASSALPKWFPKSVLGKTESWVYERSLVDLRGRVVQVITRNLDLRNLMDVQEDLFIREDVDGGGFPDDHARQHRHGHGGQTSEPSHQQQQQQQSGDRRGHIWHENIPSSRIDTSVAVFSSFGLPFLRSRIEVFGINRYVAGVERARMHQHTMLELLRDTRHRGNLLAGRPPPLSAMLAPALGESLARWEETAAGFSGHGFDDIEEERYGVTEHHSEELLPPRRTVLEWARFRREQAVKQAAERFSNVRAKWFGWQLRMRQVDTRESAGQSRDARGGAESSPRRTDQTETPQQASSSQDQSKSQKRQWVWEWIRSR